MSAPDDRTGFLMRKSWRSDAILARRIELPGGSQAPGAARRTVTELLATRLEKSELFDVTVLISELVTNAVRHGAADEDATIVTHVAITPDVLRIEVCDRGPGFTPPAAPAPRPEGGGNGLVLLASLSTSWGVAPVEGGTCVWFERELEQAG